MREKDVMEHEATDDSPACFAFLTMTLNVNIKRCEKWFSCLFDKPVVSDGYPVGCSPQMKYCFQFKQKKYQKVN